MPCEGLQVAGRMHLFLGEAQSVPGLGAVVASPIAAVISTIQMIFGIVIGVLIGAAAVISMNERVAYHAFAAGGHALMGFVGLIFSLLNIASFNVAAIRCREIFRHVPQIVERGAGQLMGAAMNGGGGGGGFVGLPPGGPGGPHGGFGGGVGMNVQVPGERADMPFHLHAGMPPMFNRAGADAFMRGF
jgi:hypothetical protein